MKQPNKFAVKLPARTTKPRNEGITHVIDRGYGVMAVKDMLELAGEYIDIYKLGWGTAVVTDALDKKIKLLRDYDIPVCFGGSLFELHLLQNRIDEYIEKLEEYEIKHVELSTGIIELENDRLLELIAKFKQKFKVIVEVGSKDVNQVVAPYKWKESIIRALQAGAWKVICEGRESGTVGLFRHDGEIRHGLIEEIMTEVECKDIIFETPKKSQQLWFVKKFGSNVNLGNIAIDDIIALETLRLGLRGDTMLFFHATDNI